MKLDKIEMMRIKSWQCEIVAIVEEFREALRRHFKIVEQKSINLINTRWVDSPEVKELIVNE